MLHWLGFHWVVSYFLYVYTIKVEHQFVTMSSFIQSDFLKKYSTTIIHAAHLLFTNQE